MSCPDARHPYSFMEGCHALAVKGSVVRCQSAFSRCMNDNNEPCFCVAPVHRSWRSMRRVNDPHDSKMQAHLSWKKRTRESPFLGSSTSPGRTTRREQECQRVKRGGILGKCSRLNFTRQKSIRNMIFREVCAPTVELQTNKGTISTVRERSLDGA